MDNLKWEELATVNTRKASPTTHPKTDTTITNSLTLAKNASKTYYIAVWIAETGSAQNDSGSFNGTITFNTGTGDGVTSNFVSAATQTLMTLGISRLSVKTLAANYWTQAVTDSGLYSYTEDNKLNYFYRGQVKNNWVLYGGIYWRIVRITDTGEIRMIYSGTTAPTSANEYKESGDDVVAFNSLVNSAEYVGYQYTIGSQHGKGTDSPIKLLVDTWYTNSLSTSYGSHISTSTYCYDRTTYSGTVAGTNRSGTGVGLTNTWFSSAYRLMSNSSWIAGGTGPQIYCSDTNDNYSLKAGLLSVDEAAIAGLRIGSSNADKNNYLYGHYWLGSPLLFDDDGTVGAVVFGIFGGSLTANNVDGSRSFTMRPVISLNQPSGIVSGTTGTYDHPYEFTW